MKQLPIYFYIRNIFDALHYSGQILGDATLMQPLAKNNGNLQVLIGFMSLVRQEVSAGSEKELLLNQQANELGTYFSLYDMVESDSACN